MIFYNINIVYISHFDFDRKMVIFGRIAHPSNNEKKFLAHTDHDFHKRRPMDPILSIKRFF